MIREYDFAGWATKNDLRCSDGRTIRRGAFKDDDGKVVPLVWMHDHDNPENVLGHALLEYRDEGTYAYCSFNKNPQGENAKELVEHGDITALSIYARHLKQHDGDVLHGSIKEVSLVLAGANPGAYIDEIKHGDEEVAEQAILYIDSEDCLLHSSDNDETSKDADQNDKELEHAEENSNNETKKGENDMAEEKTVKDVIDSMTEEQKKVLYALVATAAEEANNKEDSTMKHSAFDNDYEEETLQHADVEEIFANAKRLGSLKDALQHADEEYGIENIDYLYPEDRLVSDEPDFIKRDDSWVSTVMNGVHHTPFSRIKSIHANITEDEARALGYIKGNFKKEEVFTLLKRSTTPTTIYKKQKLDRDDLVDITDFNVVAWIKKEMRMMLNEEIARAILVGDNRLSSSDDKIDETHIRPVWKDNDLYTVKNKAEYTADDTEDTIAKNFIKRIIKSRKLYKGSGDPTLYTTEDMLTNMLLLEDGIGHLLYDSKQKLCTALRVKDIITVPVFEGLTREGTGADAGKTFDLEGILVNLTDYTVGADKGGAVAMFDDFDIDYNQQKYLMETRCSGALTKPYSAIAFEGVAYNG